MTHLKLSHVYFRFFFFGSKIESYTICTILQYLNITVFFRLFDGYIGGVMGNIILIVSAYMFTYAEWFSR